ncbi:hypothetical protein [Acanthopleuribacter pedis]|uniref:Uncharacterized protein n=1 Tax=Acanthopleuribacter pedis TaxID=442870 RepID=A0A8J7Q6P9_9BACT|nr:hypothetical protein [Acanthopleuribacter pedis]MBO1318972.1 hypothetical protein [Acanthopleuribacter pedis]
MLFRCHIPHESDTAPNWEPLRQCVALAHVFAARGYRVAFAVHRGTFDRAKAVLGEAATLYRVPQQPDQELPRLSFLRRTHNHHICVVAMPKADAAYTFGVQRQFPFTVVLGADPRANCYGKLLVNPHVEMPSTAFQCSAESKLLLGPRFYIRDPNEPPPGENGVPRHLMLVIGDDEPLLDKLLAVRRHLPAALPVTVVGYRNPDVRRKCAAFAVGHPHLPLHYLTLKQAAEFPFSPENFYLVDPATTYLDLAQRGMAMMTVAGDTQKLNRCYMLEQLGVAPTLGWFSTKKEAEMAATISARLRDTAALNKQRGQAQKVVDGRGAERIAHFVPSEVELGGKTPALNEASDLAD